MFDFLKPKQDRHLWGHIRPCVCGAKVAMPSGLPDMVYCGGCGLMYMCNHAVENPFAKLFRVDEDGNDVDTDKTA